MKILQDSVIINRKGGNHNKGKNIVITKFFLRVLFKADNPKHFLYATKSTFLKRITFLFSNQTVMALRTIINY